MPEERIVVSAVGIITALGTGYNAHASALKRVQSGLGYAKNLHSKHASEFLVGEVAESNYELAAALNIDDIGSGTTRTTMLAMTAIKDLLSAGNMDAEVLRSPMLAFINSSTVGGMNEVEQHYLRFIGADDASEVRQYIDRLDCADSTEVAGDYFGLTGFRTTISTACSSSANAVMTGARMIRNGIAETALCGGTDALSRFTLNGFNSLKNIDRTPCRPFDHERAGLNLGEGAAYLLLEKESAAKARGGSILAVLSGYSNTNDAYHPTAPSPDGHGALHAMQEAIRMSGIVKEDIGYINAHGTATLANDLSEGRAIQQLWEGTPPPFSSTKPFTGHTLAAAGAVEAIFSLIALREAMLIPNLNFRLGMEELSIVPVLNIAPAKEIQHVLSNSFGFGGNNVTLIFSRP